MNFELNPEQQQFADAIARWADKHYGFEQRKAILHSASGVSDAAWAALVELGVTALPVPAEYGGFDGTAVDQGVVIQALGRALVIEPVLATALGTEFLKRAGGQHTLLAQVARGELKLACALSEPQSRYELSDIETRASHDDKGWVLRGLKSGVLHGAQADYLIVSARSAGEAPATGQTGVHDNAGTHKAAGEAGAEADNTAGVSLFVIPADLPGIQIDDARCNDGMRIARVTLSDVRVPDSALLGAAGDGWALLDAVTDHGIALLCSEALGVMEALFDATLDYLKTRQQFGVPIGKFQVLQHRMADMFIHLEQARSMALLAAVKAGSDDPVERRRSVSAAKARIGEAMKFVGQQALQLHGGMGVTNELPAAHLFKRLAVIELTLGDTDHHLARFAAQPGFAAAL